MTPRRLPNSSAIALFEGAHVLADAQRLRAAAQHRDDRFDLAVVVDAARVVDAPSCHGVARITPTSP